MLQHALISTRYRQVREVRGVLWDSSLQRRTRRIVVSAHSSLLLLAVAEIAQCSVVALSRQLMCVNPGPRKNDKGRSDSIATYMGCANTSISLATGGVARFLLVERQD